MKKILSILVCVCVLLSAMVITASAADTTIVFEFGANGNATHDDGSNNGFTSKSYTEGNYTLALTNATKAYYGARDAKGNSAIKLGSSSDVGGFQFVAPDDVTSVIIKVAKYKAKNTIIKINGTEHTITTSSNDGAYTAITVDTTSTKAITVETVSGKTRCMIDSITFVIPEATGGETGGEGGGEEPSCEHTAKSAVPNGDETHKLVCDACSETVTPVVECTDADANGKCDICEGDVAVPFDPTDKTAAEIVDAAYALAAGEKIEGVTLTGVITEIVDAFSTQFNNITVDIAVDGASADKLIRCFRVAGEGADTLAVGDKITVSGTLTNYVKNGTSIIEFEQGCTLDAVVKAETPDDGGDVTPPAGDEGEDVTPPAEDATLAVVDTPVAGTAYKFGMVQGNLDKTLYLTGEMDSFYYATTEDASAAADVYLEEADGGYNIYAMVNGAKKYLNIVEAMGSDGNMHTNAVFGDTAVSVYTYDETLATFVTAVGDKSYGFGTRNDREYTTISPCASTYVDNFFCKFYAEAKSDDTTGDDTTGGDSTTGGTTTGGTTGGSTTGSTTTTPEVKPNTDNSTTSPDTGDNMGAVAMMAIAAAAVLVASKKR